MTETRRKTHTSTEAGKRRYNAKVYTQISASIPKEIGGGLQGKRVWEGGVPQAQVIKAAIERFLEETEPEQKNFDVL